MPYPVTSLAACGIETTAEALFAGARRGLGGAGGDSGTAAAASRRSASAGSRARPGIGGPIAVKVGDETVSGTFETIDLEGRLVVRGGDGTARPISAGDVHFGNAADGGGALMAADELGLRAARRRRRNRHESRALRLRPRPKRGNGSPSTWASPSATRRCCRASTPCSPTSASCWSAKSDLVGIAITHAHEDHYGALFDFWPKLEAPVFMTPFAAALLEAKRAGEPNAPKIAVRIVQQGERVTAGPFEVEYVPVSHSIPEPNALAIRTPLGTVFHTGDWKLDPAPGIGRATDNDRIAAIGEEGVLALVSDSTNADPRRHQPERRRGGASARAAHRRGAASRGGDDFRLERRAPARGGARRRIAPAARSSSSGAPSTAPSTLRVSSVTSRACRNSSTRTPTRNLPRNKVVALMTGSQGEPRAALAKVAAKDHRALSLAPGDRVIFSSRTIPGNERPVNTIINALVDFGAEVITDRDALVHTSGPSAPRRAAPALRLDQAADRRARARRGAASSRAGEARPRRRHAAGDRGTERPHDTACAGTAPRRLDSVAHGRLYRDGKLLVSHEASGVAERRRLSFAGIVSVAIVLSDGGEVLEDPTVALLGLPESDSGGERLRAIVEEAVDDALDGMSKPKRRDADAVREAVRRSVRGEVDAAWGKKPQMIVHVVHVSD